MCVAVFCAPAFESDSDVSVFPSADTLIVPDAVGRPSPCSRILYCPAPDFVTLTLPIFFPFALVTSGLRSVKFGREPQRHELNIIHWNRVCKFERLALSNNAKRQLVNPGLLAADLLVNQQPSSQQGLRRLDLAGQQEYRQSHRPH